MAIGEVREKIKPRKDGTTYKVYEGEYRDENGDRAYVSDSNKHEARRKLREAEKAVKDGTHAKGSETLGQVMEEYADDREQDARRGDITKGYAKAERSVLALVPDSLKRMRISDFKHSAEIEKAIKGLRDQGYALSTVKRVKDTLSRVFSFAMKPKPGRTAGYIARNVIRDYPFLTGRPPKRRNEATEEEGALLLLAARRYKSRHPKGQMLAAVNVYGLLSLIILSGMRPEEACALHVRNVSRFEFPPADRPDVWAEVYIKERNTREDKLMPGTKDGPNRIVQVDRGVVDALDAVERYWQAHSWATGPGHESYTAERVSWRIMRFLESSDVPLERRKDGRVFLGKEGTLYNSHSLAKYVRTLVLQAGIVERDDAGRVLIGEDGKPKPRISLYSFRHKVATDNATLLPLAIAAAETGHSEGTYQKHYVHKRPEHRVLAATAMGVRARRLRAEIEKLTADEPPATKLRPHLLTHGS